MNNAETFLGNEIIEIYEQIHSKYPNGVKYISTKQLIDNDRIRYSISFIPTVETDSILELGNIEIHPTDEYPEDFLNIMKGLEQELTNIEDYSNTDSVEKVFDKELTIMEDIVSNTDAPKESCVEIMQRELVKRGIDEIWLKNTINKLIQSDITEDKNLIMNFILDELEANFTFVDDIEQKPNILMMVGPTGVGKTTSIAKMVLNFKDDIQSDNIALINLDQNRLAASEQLKSYASSFDVDYADLHEENEFISQLDEYKNKELVFVDTGGISPFDIKKLVDTVSFITQASKYEISLGLVLSATLKKEDLERMYENFSFLSIDYLIITKFDETASITGLADFLTTCGTPMYYFSVGQDIHDNLIPASSEYLRDRLAKEWQNIACKS
jgi:flagellar biosynthesis GTPase FlhF